MSEFIYFTFRDEKIIDIYMLFSFRISNFYNKEKKIFIESREILSRDFD